MGRRKNGVLCLLLVFALMLTSSLVYAKETTVPLNRYTVHLNKGISHDKMPEETIFEVNPDGLDENNNKILIYAEDYGLPLVRPGIKYVLKGLNTRANGRGSFANEGVIDGERVFYLDNLPAKKDGTVELYPIWINATNTITYKSNVDDYNNSNPETYSYGKKIFLRSASKAGYIFNGWRRDSRDGIATNLIVSDEGEDLTFYGEFTPISYKVKLNPNAATNTDETYIIDAVYDQSIDLSAYRDTYKKDGYRFVGFSTKKSGEAIENLKNLTTKNDATVNLYPVWEKID